MSSSAITTTADNRFIQDKTPAWEKVLTFTFASGDTTEEKLAVALNGLLQTIIVKVGACSGANPTMTVAIDDNADNELFSVAGLAESASYKYSVNEPVTGTIDVGVLPNTDPLSACIVTVYLRGV